MSNSQTWATALIAIAGMIGTVAAGAIGYESGSKAVNKDYVSLAIDTLQKEDASDELRKWSVDVLGELSPVPFGKKLKDELQSSGLYNTRLIVPRIPMPQQISVPCPDLIKGQETVSEELANTIISEYKKCRLKHEGMVEYVAGIDKIAAEARAQIGNDAPKP